MITIGTSTVAYVEMHPHHAIAFLTWRPRNLLAWNWVTPTTVRLEAIAPMQDHQLSEMVQDWAHQTGITGTIRFVNL